jgi:hypothetical protein
MAFPPGAAASGGPHQRWPSRFSDPTRRDPQMPCAAIPIQRVVPRRRRAGLRGCCRAPQTASRLLAAPTAYKYKGRVAQGSGSRTKAFQPTAHKDAPRLKAGVRRAVAVFGRLYEHDQVVSAGESDGTPRRRFSLLLLLARRETNARACVSRGG